MTVADSGRLLLWDHTPRYTFEPASFVWGQAGDGTNIRGIDYRGISAVSMGHPADIAVQGDTVAVADRGNNRVLLFDRNRVIAGNRTANVVLGQATMSGFVANRDQNSPSASTMASPSGIALDGTHLVVADSSNHRVLIWNRLPTRDGQPADIVLGQSDFASSRPNHGSDDRMPRDGLCDADAMGMFEPMGVATDGTHLYVADRVNNRVLVWNQWPNRAGQVADAVIGQSTLSDAVANRGRGTFVADPDGLNYPMGVTVEGDNLWIADTENNRVVRISDRLTRPRAVQWLGQSNGSTVGNFNVGAAGTYGVGTFYGYSPTATGVITPRAVALTSDKIYVTEAAVHRVHVFSRMNGSSLGVLGQRGATEQVANSGGIGAQSLSNPLGVAADSSRLWIADSQNARVVAHPLGAALGLDSRAQAVLGQQSFVQNGFNESSSARGAVVRGPRGIWQDDRDVLVADSDNHRVLRFAAPWTDRSVAIGVYGQPNDSLAIANRGGVPSAGSLNNPRGVFATESTVYVADTQNHRVLMFRRAVPAGDAVGVLGQADFVQVSRNRGGAVSARTLNAPEGIFADSTHLYVADSGNHRVLVWNTPTPTSGQPADAVLGQATFVGNEGNRGMSATSANAMLFPIGMLGISGALYVADSGNNRVLRFDRAPRPGEDLSASIVLGQASATSRQAAVLADNLELLAGPIALAQDGVNLFVLDRDIARVVLFPLGQARPQATSVLKLATLGSPLVRRPSGLTTARGPFFTTNLLVSDPSNDRVIVASPSLRAQQR
ncbi:MAG: hypothetical protein Q8Q09_26500 [Deltaproteobacteria bacterium]|nr:hypothetical protein [Deltaproteobacteria bacterium]